MPAARSASTICFGTPKSANDDDDDDDDVSPASSSRAAAAVLARKALLVSVLNRLPLSLSFKKVVKGAAVVVVVVGLVVRLVVAYPPRRNTCKRVVNEPIFIFAFVSICGDE